MSDVDSGRSKPFVDLVQQVGDCPGRRAAGCPRSRVQSVVGGTDDPVAAPTVVRTAPRVGRTQDQARRRPRDRGPGARPRCTPLRGAYAQASRRLTEQLGHVVAPHPGGGQPRSGRQTEISSPVSMSRTTAPVTSRASPGTARPRGTLGRDDRRRGWPPYGPCWPTYRASSTCPVVVNGSPRSGSPRAATGTAGGAPRLGEVPVAVGIPRPPPTSPANMSLERYPGRP